MKVAQDLNYKVALASGVRELRAGRLREAEQQFRYLCDHFPAGDGGYRGLAKVLLELDDRPAALATLRDGAAKLAKAGQRTAAIVLLREAVALDPLDAASHRRLASAHALAGETDAAVREYLRYARAADDARQREAARREIRYAVDTLGSRAELVTFAARLGISIHETTSADGALEPSEPADPAAAEQRAAEFIATNDPRAARAALAAARHFIAEGRTNAASDLLLQLIASGLADHQAQRLLVEVVSSIGKHDVAREKCELLAEALRLDGQVELAMEVEQLARAV
ncbi:MAG TPA: hypothetical protein VF998_11380 [Candidatus Limnocylindria bacterium]